MNASIRLAVLSFGLAVLAPSWAHAHAFLEHAVPSVGSTVSAPPGELQLKFTEGVVPALSGVRIAAAGGAVVAASKAVGEAGNPEVLDVHLAHPLKPGTYVVTWHVVSVDTHRTSGSYKFTVSP